MFLFHLNLTVKRCGNLIFDVVLKFSIEVAEDDIIFLIQNAAADGRLGGLSVNVSYLILNPRVGQTTITSPTSTTTKSGGLLLVLTESGNLRVSLLFASSRFNLDSLSLLGL